VRNEISHIENGLHISTGWAGKAVIETAQMLETLGYNVGNAANDGKFKNQMDAAVKKFQTKQGLRIDGMIGQKTLAALKEATQK